MQRKKLIGIEVVVIVMASVMAVGLLYHVNVTASLQSQLIKQDTAYANLSKERNYLRNELNKAQSQLVDMSGDLKVANDEATTLKSQLGETQKQAAKDNADMAEKMDALLAQAEKLQAENGQLGALHARASEIKAQLLVVSEQGEESATEACVDFCAQMLEAHTTTLPVVRPGEPDSIDGIAKYISGYLAEQIADAVKHGEMLKSVSLTFGHSKEMALSQMQQQALAVTYWVSSSLTETEQKRFWQQYTNKLSELFYQRLKPVLQVMHDSGGMVKVE